MTSNHTWLSFLLLRTRNFIGVVSWSYQKDAKRSSNRMEDIWLIKVHFLHRKNWVWFHTKKPKLLSSQLIISRCPRVRCTQMSLRKQKLTRTQWTSMRTNNYKFKHVKRRTVMLSRITCVESPWRSWGLLLRTPINERPKYR